MADAGVTQAELSRATGVGQPTISRILKPDGPKGIKEPTDKQVRPIADYFGVTTDQLRGHTPIPEAPIPSAAPRSPSEADYALIPQYTAKGDCGNGYLNDHV